jgi:hypothetical protein
VRIDVSLAIALAAGAMSCGSGGGFPDARPIDAPPKPGTYSVEWTLTDSAGSAVTCTAAGAQSVVGSVHNDVTDDAFSETFFCGVNAGTSGDVVPGTYDISFLLEDGSGNTLATSAAQKNIVVTAATNTALSPLTFVVSSAP